jgi:hypothetical protein
LRSCPVLIVGGWILIATQPGSGWEEGRLHSWSNSIGILGVAHSIGLWHGVLAFGIGLMLGLSFDGVPAPVEEEAAPGYGWTAPPADEPVAAERRYAARSSQTTPSATAPTDDTQQTQTRTRIPSR